MFGQVFASGTPTPEPGPGQGSMWTSLIIMVAVFAVFYVILILPQKKQKKKLRTMIDALKPGDEIITIGGVYGKIVSIKDETVTIESGPDRSKIKFAKSAIKTCVTTHDDEPEK